MDSFAGAKEPENRIGFDFDLDFILVYMQSLSFAFDFDPDRQILFKPLIYSCNFKRSEEK